MAGSVSGPIGTRGILFFGEKKRRGEKFYYAVLGVLHGKEEKRHEDRGSYHENECFKCIIFVSKCFDQCQRGISLKD
jgi:hypothetical protein